jgi:hypothetical protein
VCGVPAHAEPRRYVSSFKSTFDAREVKRRSSSAIGFSVTANGSARLFAALGAGSFILVLLASLAVLVPLQRRIIATSPAQSADIEAMRLRWFSGNLGRSLFSVASFALMVVATTV